LMRAETYPVGFAIYIQSGFSESISRRSQNDKHMSCESTATPSPSRYAHERRPS
jgi:hypothetical protein